MFEIPSRDDLRQLAESTAAVAPTSVLGFTRIVADGRVSMFYSSRWGIGELVLPGPDLLDALVPTGPVREANAETLAAGRMRAAEGFLINNEVRRVVAVPISGSDAPTLFWVGFLGTGPLTADQHNRLEAVAAGSAALLEPQVSPDEQIGQLRRLEQAAALIPALQRVLDVRSVIDRLSAAAKPALPHDLLLLNLLSDDFTTFTDYARSDLGPRLTSVQPNRYPAAALRAWIYSTVDDHMVHPIERDSPATKIGARSTLRFPIRFDDRVIGGVTFASFKPYGYSGADVAVGKRLSDHVASAISHFQMAERLAEQAKRAEELHAQTTNLELLDELLSALTETRGVRDVFERISAIARKVVVHDALALPVFIGNGRQALPYATIGMGERLPEVIPVPEYFLQPDWEYDLIDDVTTLPEEHNKRVKSLGFQSVLRVPVRVDGRSAGALILLAKSRAAFKPADVLVARRIADRIAVTLARDREIEADKRAVEAIERAARLEARVRALTDELDARTGYRRVIGDSPTWKHVLTQSTQVAATESTVLLTGESGTGKEVIARFLHRGSKRSAGPFVALNCAALPEQLLEAELFGYERGAYTGATQSKPGQLEQAAGGTLFLDEVAEMSPSSQAKFLRVLQEHEFQRLGGTRVIRTDARVIAATNRDLQRSIANGQFREDLFYRLNVFPIRLPPLRDRRDDILPLSEAFLKEIGDGLGRPPGGMSREARALLLQYHWPGNVRELRNILERAAILCDGGLITGEHLAFTVAVPSAGAVARDVAPPAPAIPAAATSAPPASPVSVQELNAAERTMIEQALKSARFNKSKAAKALGLTRHQLYVRMRKYGFD